MKEKGRKGRYLNNTVATFRHYSNYTKDPAYNFDFYAVKRSAQRSIPDEIINKFLKCRNPYPLRSKKRRENWDMWTLYWELVAYCGLRPIEPSRVSKEDFDWGGKLFYCDGKTTQEDPIPIPDYLYKKLYAYVFSLQRKELFVSHTGNPITKSTFYQNFRQRMRFIGIIDATYRPHHLRHSKATRLVAQGVNLSQVMDIMRHSRLSTTLPYIHNNPEVLRVTTNRDRLINKAVGKIEKMKALRETVENQGYIVKKIDEVKRGVFSLEVQAV